MTVSEVLACLAAGALLFLGLTFWDLCRDPTANRVVCIGGGIAAFGFMFLFLARFVA